MTVFSDDPSLSAKPCRRFTPAVIAFASLFSPLTFAQEDSSDDDIFELDEFIVRPVQASLVEAQEVKKSAAPFVDAIVAQDIGKLPDNTVADALQRVPGIQVTRGSGEVTSVLIRGLPNLATTLNGEEIFTGTGRGVTLSDLPADLISSVNVYKSRTADQVEGGIAGLIDVRLRNPFDFDGSKTAGTLRLIHGEDSGDTSWVGSLMNSNRWELDGGGQLGVLVAASRQDIKYQDQTIYNFEWGNRPATNSDGDPLVYPFNSGPIVHRGDRQRNAFNLNIQYAPKENVEFYTNWLYTGYRNQYQNYFFVGLPFTGAVDSFEPYPGTDDVPAVLETSNHFLITSTQAYDDKTDGYNGVFGVRTTNGDTTFSSEFIYNYNKFTNQNLIMDIAKGGIPEVRMTFHPNFDASYPGSDISDPAGYGLWGLFDNNGFAEGESTVWRADVTRLFGTQFFNKLSAGVRWSEREVGSRQSDRADVAPADGRGVTAVSSIDGLGATSPDNSSGLDISLENWYTPSADFLYNNADQVRSLFGLPPGLAPFNPAVAFDDTETTYAAYVQAGYGMDLGEMPLDGQIGVRVVKTELSLRGYDDGVPIDSSSDETEVLPVLNGKLQLTPTTYLRGSFGRSITRPEFSDLNPVVNLSGPTTTGGGTGTGSGGNPNLGNVESDNYDLSLERYYSDNSFFSIAGFHREISGYVFTDTEVETVDGEQYAVTRPRNTGSGSLSGVEFGVQHFFEAVDGLGIQANYTIIDGETYDPVADETLDLANVSENSYNLILVFERNKFSTRLAYNWRDAYIEDFNNVDAPGGPGGTVVVDATDRFDFSASYAFNENMTLSLDVTNLFKEGRQDYFDAVGSPYPRDARMYDRTVELGFRFRF
ncbi:TonB-dependent receptor [Pelagicoccus sp. SDUM812003]|uniref:TonB-dependent receptor n=1 Tax=Pelagicoccus sp. SDUM812003 TaxID=3041267 RepID=UPI0028100077|nr:TonB-dependent receptor [Pelagicoccus sp. SDUM812003]MDQ8205006.1 TonB-dependent receptor [Pelagicoccus sp. SDUM812003]